jgi:hypothetical protein
MSEINDEAYKEVRQELEKLELENSEVKKAMLTYSRLAEHTHEMGARINELKSLLNRAADALESGSSETHFQLIQELRKAAQP